jgi:hypothetical protein
MRVDEERLLSFFAKPTANESSLTNRGNCKNRLENKPTYHIPVLCSALQLRSTKPARMRGHGMHNHSAPLKGVGEKALSKMPFYPNTLLSPFLFPSFSHKQEQQANACNLSAKEGGRELTGRPSSSSTLAPPPGIKKVGGSYIRVSELK